MPAAIPIAIGVGSVASGIMGGRAAGKAANAQSQAAMYAAQLQKQAADDALAFQKDQWNTTQANQKPWLTAGTSAINTLASLMSPGGQLASVPTFTAPTAVTEQNDPGYQFRLQQGMKALEASAAARGGLFSGGTGKSLNRYAQDYASNEYGNVYNRALTDYNSKLNAQSTLYNRYAGVAGVGQTAANQLGAVGQNMANNASNIMMSSAANIGQQYNNAAAARASGYVGAANAYGNMFSNLSQIPMMMPMFGGGGGYGGTPTFFPSTYPGTTAPWGS